jgi:hypothetical protein
MVETPHCTPVQIIFSNPRVEKCIPVEFRNRDSVFGIATSYGLNDRGIEFESWKGQEFSLLHYVQTGSGIHPTPY